MSQRDAWLSNHRKEPKIPHMRFWMIIAFLAAIACVLYSCH